MGRTVYFQTFLLNTKLSPSYQPAGKRVHSLFSLTLLSRPIPSALTSQVSIFTAVFPRTEKQRNADRNWQVRKDVCTLQATTLRHSDFQMIWVPFKNTFLFISQLAPNLSSWTPRYCWLLVTWANSLPADMKRLFTHVFSCYSPWLAFNLEPHQALWNICMSKACLSFFLLQNIVRDPGKQTKFYKHWALTKTEENTLAYFFLTFCPKLCRSIQGLRIS